MRWALCAVFIWVLVQPVFAAPLTVITGEHDRFTRVVVSLPKDADWQFGRVENGYALRLPIEDGYDTSGFFDLIPKDRVFDIAQDADEGELSFVVECECNAQAFEFRSDFLVIDFSDGPPNPGSPFETALSYVDPVLSQPMGPATPIRIVSPDIGRLIPLVPPREPLVEVQTIKAAQLPAGAPLSTSRQLDQERTNTVDSSTVTREISESLGRGLSEGLLNGDLQPSDDVTEAEAFLDEIVGQGFPGIAARTSIDPLAIPPSDPSEQTQTGEACLPGHLFDLASWDKGSGFHTQLHFARTKLVDAAGNVDALAIVELARLYIVFGFGKEAQQVLAFGRTNSQERQHLTALALLIEGYDVAPDLFTSQVSCPTAVALWALLAAGSKAVDAKVDEIAIIRAFKELPPQLRPMIAPSLSNQLLRIGANEAAFQTLEALSPDSASSVDMVLADAALTDALGDEDAAFEQLKDVARNGPRSSPQALARFFDEGVARETQFMDADFLLADALRFENADSLIAVELADAQFAAYLSTDRFSEAQDLLRSFENQRSSTDIIIAKDELLSDATARLDDGTFLRFMWSQDALDASLEVRNAISERFLSLGFPHKAMGILPTSVPPFDDKGLRTPSTQDWPEPLIADSEVLDGGNERQAEKLDGIGSIETGTVLVNYSEMEFPQQELTLAASRALLESAGRSREAVVELLEQISPGL